MRKLCKTNTGGAPPTRSRLTFRPMDVLVSENRNRLKLYHYITLSIPNFSRPSRHFKFSFRNLHSEIIHVERIPDCIRNFENYIVEWYSDKKKYTQNPTLGYFLFHNEMSRQSGPQLVPESIIIKAWRKIANCSKTPSDCKFWRIPSYSMWSRMLFPDEKNKARIIISSRRPCGHHDPNEKAAPVSVRRYFRISNWIVGNTRSYSEVGKKQDANLL